jgi:HlyD family secretion protein
MKNTKLIVAIVLLLAVVGVGGVAIAKKRDAGATVRTEVVGRRDLVSIVTASGVIEPKQKVDISADIAGRVIELAVEEGQDVKKGDLLLRIDPTQYQAAVQRAEATVAQAKAQSAQMRASLLKAQSDATRAEQLAKGDRLISAQDLEQARTGLKVAQAQYEAANYGVSQAEAGLSEAKESLRKTIITAPMSGRVTRLNIHQGETAVVGTMNNPGSLLLTIADLGVMEAKVNVDETDVPHIAIGDSATVKIDAFPNQAFVGHVTQIANSAVQGQGSTAGSSSQTGQAVDFEVRVTLDHPPTELRPDLSATADIVSATRKQALSVPIIAVTVRDASGKKFKVGSSDDQGDATVSEKQKKLDEQNEVEGVFVVKDGKAKWMPVTVGIAGDRYFELTKGLKGGETVVAGPYSVVRDLEDGAALQVQPESPDTKPAKEAK